MKPYNAGSGSNDQELIKKIKKLKIRNFKGVFMKDELVKLKPTTKECGIVNLESSNENGSHWCCWWKNNNNKIYFDSFGILPPKEMVRYLGEKILFSRYQIQQFNDSNCGEWCVYVLKELNNGEDFIDIILKIVNNNK